MTRALVVGAGAIARAWFDALGRQDDIVLAGVVDPREEVARRALSEAGLDLPVHPTLADGLRDADLVVNLTPPAVHRSVVTVALEAGRDVVTEKPLALDLADARAMADLADAGPGRLWVMQNRRFSAPMRAVTGALDAGALGDLSVIAAEVWMSPRHTTTYLATLPHPFLQDTGIHTLDLLRHLAGRPARRVLCHAFAPVGSWHPGTGAAWVVVEFEDGVRGEFRGDWAAPGFATGYDGAWRIVGTGGSLLWDGGRDVAVQRASDIGRGDEPGGPRTPLAVDDAEDGHPAALRAILVDRAGGARSGLDARANLATMALLDAAVRSAGSGTWAEVEATA